MIQRYKIQQDKGQYCLKGCDDGDLMDYASHEAIVHKLEAALREYGAHDTETCAMFGPQMEPCSCGFDEAMTALELHVAPIDTSAKPVEKSAKDRRIAVLESALRNISTVRPEISFPAVAALAYCRRKAIEALEP
jgi:hypothetical protein